MTELSTRSAVHGTRQALAIVALLAFLLSGGPAVGTSNADETLSPPQIPKTGMKSGRLGVVHEKGAVISGQEYSFHPKVAFADDEGNPLEWKEFKKGDLVHYHLKQERIDFLVLVLPK